MLSSDLKGKQNMLKLNKDKIEKETFVVCACEQNSENNTFIIKQRCTKREQKKSKLMITNGKNCVWTSSCYSFHVI